METFSLSNTPSRDQEPRSRLLSRSRSPSTASDLEPIEVNPRLGTFLPVRHGLDLLKRPGCSYRCLLTSDLSLSADRPIPYHGTDSDDAAGVQQAQSRLSQGRKPLLPVTRIPHPPFSIVSTVSLYECGANAQHARR